MDPEVSRWIRFISAGTTGPSSQRFSRITTVGAANFQGALGKGVCTLKEDQKMESDQPTKRLDGGQKCGRFFLCFLFVCLLCFIFFVDFF